jgi:prolyl-tRNA editing enzyme YbaK/EbsC (Cys-tRNA(Pro) deacylase)
MIVSGGKLGAQIELRPEDLLRVSEAEYADLLE